MSYLVKATCPSCGATHDIKNPAVLQVTCEYCETIYLWDKEGAKNTGKKSRLIPPLSGLWIGCPITIQNRSFYVAGRVQYGYGANLEDIRGKWDEWYLVGGDGNSIWLSEDSGKFILESKVDGALDGSNSAKAGDNFNFKGSNYQIIENGQVVCVGTQGELPFAIIPSETYLFADAKRIGSGTAPEFITIEFDEDIPTAFSGWHLKKEEIKYEKKESGETKKTEALRCPSCGSPLDFKGNKGEVSTVVCSSCQTIVNLEPGIPEALGKVQPKLAEVFAIPLGQKGNLFGKEWVVAGRLRYDWEDDGESGASLEYLLYNDIDYLWLSEENGHYYTSEEINEVPSVNLSEVPIPKYKLKINGETYQFYEKGTLFLKYVDGALPWIANLNDKVEFTDVINPPHIFSEEKTYKGNTNNYEIEYSKSTYISHTEIANAFKIELPEPVGVSPGQPFNKIPFQWALKLMGWVLGLGLMIGSCGVESPVSVLEESFNLANLQKKEIFTQSFKTEKVDDTLEIEIGADISNTWFGMGVALYKQKEEAVLSADDIGVEYYEGYEDGESWSEGSKSETIYWKVKDPGEYKLLITSNEWEAAGNTKINIRVKRDVKRVYPMILISFLWFVVPLLLWYRDKNFESRRWVSVVPESDDDDDSDGGDDD